MELFTLSKKEKELMDLLWDAGVPLSRSEILDRAATRTCTWKPNAVHILLNSMLEKGAVQVSGFYLNSRKLGRTFEPAITPEEYAIIGVVKAVRDAGFTVGSEPWATAIIEQLKATPAAARILP